MTIRNFERYYGNYPLTELREAWKETNRLDPYIAVWISRICWMIAAIGLVIVCFIIWIPKGPLAAWSRNFGNHHPMLLPLCAALAMICAFLGSILAFAFRENVQDFIQGVQEAAGLIFNQYRNLDTDLNSSFFYDWLKGSEKVMQQIARERPPGHWNEGPADLSYNGRTYQQHLQFAYDTFSQFGFLQGTLQKFYVTKTK